MSGAVPATWPVRRCWRRSARPRASRWCAAKRRTTIALMTSNHASHAYTMGLLNMLCLLDGDELWSESGAPAVAADDPVSGHNPPASPAPGHVSRARGAVRTDQFNGRRAARATPTSDPPPLYRRLSRASNADWAPIAPGAAMRGGSALAGRGKGCLMPRPSGRTGGVSISAHPLPPACTGGAAASESSPG